MSCAANHDFLLGTAMLVTVLVIAFFAVPVSLHRVAYTDLSDGLSRLDVRSSRSMLSYHIVQMLYSGEVRLFLAKLGVFFWSRIMAAGCLF